MKRLDIIELINLLFGNYYIKLLNILDVYKFETYDRNIYTMIEDLLWLYYFEEDMYYFKKKCIKLIQYIHKN
jgi:hypothetical protein